MINGVLLIVAAVLFAVLHVFEGLGMLWLWIAAFYLVAGILDLVVHVVKEKAKVRSANKKASQAENEKKKAEESRRQAEEANAQISQPKQEEKV